MIRGHQFNKIEMFQYTRPEDSTKALMNKYGFRHYTQFSRFCKNYLQATPAQLIASIKKK